MMKTPRHEDRNSRKKKGAPKNSSSSTSPGPDNGSSEDSATPSGVAPLTPDERADRLWNQFKPPIEELTRAVVGHPQQAESILHQIERRLHKQVRTESYTRYERPWVFKIAVDKLLSESRSFHRPIIEQERNPDQRHSDPEHRLEEFSDFFRKLRPELKLILLLKDRMKLDFSEIAMTMNQPEASLKLLRTQAYKALEAWIWEAQ